MKGPAIYILKHMQAIVYIGYTADITLRIQQHRDKVFDCVISSQSITVFQSGLLDAQRN
jgi:predicted GIY-YIG superfamily endonuclease